MRIIAGEFRGRRLVAPTGRATRPTSDRVREAWFSMLGPLDGLALDLYAGTGALGFEALSRGAKRVVFVESGRAAQDSINRNADTLGVTERITLISSTVEAASRSLSRLGPFDLVLTDPPWTHMTAAELALKRLLTSELLAADGRIVLGHPHGKPVSLTTDSGLIEEKQRSWGDSAATFLCRASDKPSL
jgi:16S rRNA (guanine966-N2)-methyltransferase